MHKILTHTQNDNTKRINEWIYFRDTFSESPFAARTISIVSLFSWKDVSIRIRVYALYHISYETLP